MGVRVILDAFWMVNVLAAIITSTYNSTRRVNVLAAIITSTHNSTRSVNY